MKTTAGLISEAREAASDPDIAADGDWWANNGRRVACELADALERATSPAGDIEDVVVRLRKIPFSFDAAALFCEHAAGVLIHVAAERDAAKRRYDIAADVALEWERKLTDAEAERDAEKARADAAEVELVTALAKRARAENARDASDAERNAAVASAAAMREALARIADSDKNREAFVMRGAFAMRDMVAAARAGLRDGAGAELLAERDQLRKLCADAASVIRILAGVPPAGVAVPPGGSELIARLEAASK